MKLNVSSLLTSHIPLQASLNCVRQILSCGFRLIALVEISVENAKHLNRKCYRGINKVSSGGEYSQVSKSYKLKN